MTQAIESDGLRTVIWDVTSKCNLRCRHCYNADKYFQGQTIPELTPSEAERAIDICKQNSIAHLHLLGGEPLKRPDLFDLVQRVRSAGMSISLTTNATLLTEDICNKLIEHEVSPVFISLDGVKKETSEFIRGQGTYDLTLKNIKLLQDAIKSRGAAVEIIISFTVTNHNKAEISLLPGFCAGLGIKQINLSCLYEAGNSCNKKPHLQYEIPEVVGELERMSDRLQNMDSAPKIMLELRPRFTAYLNRRYPGQKSIKYMPEYSRCLAGGPLFYMEANGDIHPCHATNNAKGKQAQSEGRLNLAKTNVLDYSENKFETSPYISTFNTLKNASNYKQKLETCRDCQLIHDCDPCPIVFYDNTIVPECDWLKRHELEYYKELLPLSPAVNPGSDSVSIDATGRHTLKLETGGISQEIFSQIDGRVSTQQIIQTIAAKYPDAPQDVLLRDICEYLLDLRRHGVAGF